MARKLSNYSPTVERWVRDFIDSMDQGVLKYGNRSGEEPLGIKIIFAGYGFNEDSGRDDDRNVLCFKVFIHRDSLSVSEFPPHQEINSSIVHRLDQEVCINVTYIQSEDLIEVIPFEEGDTELDHKFVYRLIRDLELGNYE